MTRRKFLGHNKFTDCLANFENAYFTLQNANNGKTKNRISRILSIFGVTKFHNKIDIGNYSMHILKQNNLKKYLHCSWNQAKDIQVLYVCKCVH